MGESRTEKIIRSITAGAPYTEPAGSDIEDALLELKEAIEGGGVVVDENVKIGLPTTKAITGQKGYVTLHGLAVKDAAAKKIYFYVDSNSTSDDYEIVRTGVLAYKLSDTKTAADVTPENMIVENAEALGLINGGRDNVTRYSPSMSNVVSDVEYEIVVRPYVKFSDDSYVYGDIIETSYTEVATKYPDYLIPSLPAQAETGISFTMRWNVDISRTISEMGVIYADGEYSKINIDTPNTVTIPVPALCNHGICTNTITDTGNGVSVVGYCIIDGVTYYTKTLTAYYDSMIHED